MEKNNRFHNVIEWVICIIIAIVLAVIFRYFIGTPTIVKMKSMYPTLEEGDRLWINRWARTVKSIPEREDIITFEEPSKLSYTESEIDVNNPIAKYNKKSGLNWFINNFLEIGKRSYIKRVIALPGEHVEIKEGKVYINGQELDEDYLIDGVSTTVTKNNLEYGYDNFVVPENYIFAMGDNRNNSKDCRNFGCIPLEKVEGIVSARIWPFNKLGKIE